MKKVLFLALVALCSFSASAKTKMKALIIDGQNNHVVWPKATLIMKKYLEDTGLFEVDIARTKYIWRSGREKASLPLANAGESQDLRHPKTDPDFNPDFSKYKLVVSNFGWQAAPLPEQTKKNFETYMKNGGGLVVVHAANNSWPRWKEFNEMIGLGGWGGRNEKSGPYVYYNKEGKVVRDMSPGKGGDHGPKHPYVVTMRDTTHPITKGLPKLWMHAKDELYAKLRGPAKNMKILATGCDIPKLQKEGRHEPALMVLDYHKGRVFHTVFGDDVPAYECVGFMVTFQRGAEWAATNKVTQKIPADFPTEEKISKRKFSVK